MKKFLSVILSVMLVGVVLVGCGAKDSDKVYTDGTYEVEAENFDEHGWKAQLKVVIEDDKISEVNYDYVNEEGNLKSKDAGYNKMMKEKSGTNPEEFSPELANRLIEAQDVENVDVVTGATHSTDRFKKLAKVAIENAKAGTTEKAVVNLEE